MKRKVNVEFIFETDDTKSEEEIRNSIEEQIYTDLNYYYQCDYDTATMGSVEVIWDGKARKTISSWDELCRYIKDINKRGMAMKLVPVRWYGEMEKDSKTKKLSSEIGADKVESITFEISLRDKV